MTSDAPTLRFVCTDARATFVLRRLEVFNWGAFCGLHSIDIDPNGTAIVGATGSGKTTLIDALMTLLAERPHYNLASSGGHDPDRTLSAYVRGEPGKGSAVSQRRRMLRPGITTSGIAALFEDGDESLCLTVLFWYLSPEELHHAWICSHGLKEPLEYWLTLHQASGLKGLNRLARDMPGLQVTTSKQEYLGGVRRFFDVGDNAFTLLNRAAGLKHLDSVDDLFRKQVLDDVSRFEEARRVADDFNTLMEIHAELSLARSQAQSLEPIAAQAAEHQALSESLSHHEELCRILPIWYAQREHRSLTSRIAALEEQLAAQVAVVNDAHANAQCLGDQECMLREHFLRAGGGELADLIAHIETQRKIVSSCMRSAEEYVRLATGAGLDTTITAEAFGQNHTKLAELTTGAIEQHRLCRDAAGRLHAMLQRLQSAHDKLGREHEQVQTRPTSNLPIKEQRLRTRLSQTLGLDDAQLPFLGELVEIPAAEAPWRGAIERALGGHRFRILIPAEHMAKAWNWVNTRHNEIHVRLQEVGEGARPAEFMPDGFARKLNYKPHPYREVVKALLAKIDRHCVDTLEQLQAAPFSLTREGSMSGARGQFEKHAQKRLNGGWVTGFSNEDHLIALESQMRRLHAEVDELSRELHTADQATSEADSMLTALTCLARFRFEDIDGPGNQRILNQLERQLRALQQPQSQLARAKDDWEHATGLLGEAQEAHRYALLKRQEIETCRNTACDAAASALSRIGAGLTDAQVALANTHLPIPAEDAPDPRAAQALAENRIHGELQQIGHKLGDLEKCLVHLMTTAKHLDNGSLTEAGTTIEDLPAYVARLRLLTEEALPAKQKQFLAYLNKSSDQQVTNLLSDIDNEVERIEERVADLNSTLQRVDFTPGTFLQLIPQRVVHESLKALQRAQKNIRSAALMEDEGESHFEALKALVRILRDASEHPTNEGAKALLDPRYRLQFTVTTIQRDTQELLQVRTGSQGDSGGEKETIACFVLIASLGYALCPAGRPRPLFGTVVLDEAFSKTSSGIGTMIMTAMRELGLHPILVTPNKEFRLLRQHTKAAIIVQHHEGRSMTSWFRWEILDQMNARRQGH